MTGSGGSSGSSVSIELRAGGQLLALGTPRQQAALVVEAPRPVAIETLIDRVWDDAPPVTARNVLLEPVPVTLSRRYRARTDSLSVEYELVDAASSSSGNMFPDEFPALALRASIDGDRHGGR